MPGRLSPYIIIAGFLGAAIVPTPASGQSGEGERSRAKAEIQLVLTAQQAAWNRGEIEEFMKGYWNSPNTVFVSGDDVTRGWQTVYDRYRSKYSNREKMGTLQFSELEIQPLNDDAALVLGRWALDRAADKPHGRFTLIFKRTADGWKIVHDHTSAASP
ncbi:MAG: hypothetical protein QOH39_2822 [Verrucomicrobiota bacterium]|jgi:ketosteroid isomerase-like protein